MHPEILRMMSVQHSSELRARAHQSRLARMVKSARRGPGRPDEAAGVVLPPVPDYVDGSFRTEPGLVPVDGRAAGGTGHAPAAQHAA